MRKNEYSKLLISYHKPKNRGYSEKSARFQSHCWYFFNILAMSFNISGFFQHLHCHKIFLKGWKMKMKWKSLSHVQLFATPWTVHGILQARLLEWVAIPFSRGPSHPGIKPRSPALQEDALTSEPPGKWDPKTYFLFSKIHLNQILSNQVHSMYLWPWIISIC